MDAAWIRSSNKDGKYQLAASLQNRNAPKTPVDAHLGSFVDRVFHHLSALKNVFPHHARLSFENLWVLLTRTFMVLHPPFYPAGLLLHGAQISLFPHEIAFPRKCDGWSWREPHVHMK